MLDIHELQNDSTIIIKESDKGRGVVMMDIVVATVSGFGLSWDLLGEIDFLVSSYTLTYS